MPRKNKTERRGDIPNSVTELRIPNPGRRDAKILKISLSSKAIRVYHRAELNVALGETRMNSVCIRKLLLCGLALLVAGMGAGAIARLPRALNPGTEEEIRHTDSEVIGSRATVLLRPARRSAAGSRGERKSGINPARTAIARDLAAHVPRSLRALQVRIEV